MAEEDLNFGFSCCAWMEFEANRLDAWGLVEGRLLEDDLTNFWSNVWVS